MRPSLLTSELQPNHGNSEELLQNRRSHARREADRLSEYLVQVFESVPDAIAFFDQQWRITFANTEARRLSRILPEHMNSRTHWELFPETVGTEVEIAYRRVMEERAPEHLEHFYAPYKLWVDIHAFPVRDGMAIHYRDVTDRKLAEMAMAVSDRQHKQALEATTDGVLSLDREWNFTFLNQFARGLLRVKGDLLGKNLWSEFPFSRPDDPFVVNYKRTMDERVTTHFVAYYPAPLNKWFSVKASPSDEGIVVFFQDVTEEKRAEQLLEEQRDLVAFVQQTAHTAFWEVDVATGELSFGSSSYEVFGHPLSSLRTMDDFLRTVHPADLEMVVRNAERAITSGETMVQEFRVIASDGRVLWLEARGKTVLVEDGAKKLRGMTLDVSDRKRVQLALAESEERYRVLADLNPQAIWMGAPDGEITYANHGFLTFIGLTKAELADGGWLRAFYPDDQERVVAAWKHAVVTGEEYHVEARLIAASDGTPRWSILRAKPVRDTSGKILHWLGVSIDIHDQKMTAEALLQKQMETERQRAELESVYQTAPVGLALFDPVEFRYLRLNDRQAEIVGLPKENVLGRTLTEIAPIEGLNEMFAQVATGHAIRNQLLEGELPTRPGEHRSWNVSYSPVYNTHGEVQAISAVSLEITNQRKAEAALVQSEKLAAVGRLASSISHEINNPLEAITNLLYIIGLSDLPKESREFLDLAQNELSRVCQIATQTLRFHRQAVRATQVTAAELVDAVLNLYHGRLMNSSIVVEAHYSTETPVVCFENDIRQVLNNLIANAIDAMRRGGKLMVRAHNATDWSAEHAGKHPAGRKGIRITVADTGHGMSAAVRARLFEPFYTTKDLNGTGLGMWISSGIVTRHQGRLSVRSTEDPERHGTVFSLFLPCSTD